MLLRIPLRSPELRPELSALLTVNLILVGRAAIVPSSARRTFVIGLLALGPLLVLAPLFFPMACLRKDPEHRYPDGRSLLRALEACVGDPSWSMEEAHLWWRAWSSGAEAPPALLEMACPTATRRELGPVSTRPFALRPR